MIGAAMAGAMTLLTRPDHCTALEPCIAQVAPTMPPIRACDELDGSPAYHVMTFHRIAPIKAANTTCSVITVESTMPFAIVVATAIERNAPAAFSTADSNTARRGDIAPVVMAVAIALAVSWNPFVKS